MADRNPPEPQHKAQVQTDEELQAQTVEPGRADRAGGAGGSHVDPNAPAPVDATPREVDHEHSA